MYTLVWRSLDLQLSVDTGCHDNEAADAGKWCWCCRVWSVLHVRLQ